MSRSWIDDRDDYETLIREFAPEAILTTKDHWLWRWAASLLWIASLGRMPRSTFLRQYATTIGPLQAYPRDWPTLPLPLIVHECQHSRQCAALGWFIPVLGWLGRRTRAWAGLLPMGVIYLLVPLPTQLAYGRLWLERDAERLSWRISLERQWLTPNELREQAHFTADRLSSSHYLWTWPRTWTRRAAARQAEALIAAHQPRRDA